MNQLPKIDQGFPKRVTNSSLVLGAATFLFLFAIGAESWAFGFGVGASLSIFSFELLRVAFKTFIRTESEKENQQIPVWRKALLLLLLLGKLPIWIGALYFAILSEGYHLIGLLLGIGLTQIVMVLKVMSLYLTDRNDETDQGEPVLSDHSTQEAVRSS